MVVGVFVALAGCVAGAVLLPSLKMNLPRSASSIGQLAVFNEVVRIVIDGYVEPVNLDRTMAGARLGLMDALDGDSIYLPEEELRLYEQDLKTKDASAEIGLTLTRRFAFLMVVSVRPGSPAEKAGVRPGDIVKTIDGKHTRPIAPPIGERLLRGAPGSAVKLSLLRPGSDQIDLSVVRERLVPTPATRMSTLPSVSCQSSGPVVRRWIAGLAGFLNCCGIQ